VSRLPKLREMRTQIGIETTPRSVNTRQQSDDLGALQQILRDVGRHRAHRADAALSTKKTKSSSRAGRVDTTSRTPAAAAPPRVPSTRLAHTSGGSEDERADERRGNREFRCHAARIFRVHRHLDRAEREQHAHVKLIWRTRTSRVRWCGSRDNSAPSAACGSV